MQTILIHTIIKAIENDSREAVKEWRIEGINHKRGGEDKSNDIEVRDGTALHWAAYYGKVEIAKLLLGNEASMLI